jgi:hypothetical protein
VQVPSIWLFLRPSVFSRLVSRVIHTVPALTCSRILRARAFFSRTVSALAVHLKGLGLALRLAIQASMVVDALEHATEDLLARDLSEQPLDEVQPG